MKLGIISDIHLEFRDTVFSVGLIDYLNSFKGEIDYLIIAGDTHHNKLIRDYFLSQLEVPYKFVMGNHDFYGSATHDDFFDEDGIVGGCLWTNFNEDPYVESAAGRNINDYYRIKDWDTTKTKGAFYNHFKRIMQSDSEIVVTHFTPSMQSVTDYFKGDILNGYFCNNLDEEIRNSNKKLWIHGHVHSDHDYMIGNCRVVSNVIGYPEELKRPFSLKIIEV